MTTHNRQNAGLDEQPSVKPQKMFHRVLSAEPLVVRQALTDVRERFRDEVGMDTLGRLELVLAEVMNNIAEHTGLMKQDGVSRPVHSIHLSIVRHTGGLTCAITDEGQSLPTECLQPRSLPRTELPDLPEGGFGWFLIQELTQSLCYYRDGSRNFLAFSVPFTE